MADADVAVARVLKHRLELDRLDYLRELRALATRLTAKEIAAELGGPPSAVEAALDEPVTDPRPGFSGATPWEVAQRFAVGQISREQVVDELARWEYPPTELTDGIDGLLVSPPGSFQEVFRALDRDLIDAEIYGEIVDRTPGGHAVTETNGAVGPDDDLVVLRVLKHRLDLARIDYVRALRALSNGLSAGQIAAELRVPPTTIEEAFAEPVAAPRSGFSGATPWEVAQRFAVGQISREQVVDELARWEYPPMGTPHSHDGLQVSPPGSFLDVIEAADSGLLDDESYAEIVTRRSDA
ncbi:hypothetical protein HD599_003024 [Conyzicola lurida]|uniref:Uncharacterized protein n=1 Tax=Conyzicola lurida TaxID=1172621 RepID=A0A841ASD6_9MICO|nr:hypothetical protein [Conyzicola lurida]MBB5844701.1 hypothetical protein [Conyzicola lurida]